MFDHSKLRGRIAERSMYLKDVSDLIGISKTSMTLKMSSKREFTVKEIFTLCEVLEIKIEDVHEYFFKKV